MEENQEILQQETQVSAEQPQMEEVIAQSEVSVPPQPPKEDHPNFRSLREKAQRAEQERDELYRMLQEERSRKSAVPEEDLSINIGEDEIAEGKHLSKVQKKISRLEQQLQNYQQQTAQIAIEAKLRVEYPDIESVISPDNLKELADKYPAVAKTLDSNNDLYNKAIAAYTMIKNLNIGQPDPYAQEKARAQQNAARPKTANYVSPQQGESPLTKANAFVNGLTPELKQQLWKEMEDAAKRA